MSRHRPPALDDARFRKAIKHLTHHQAFTDLDSAERGETVLFRLHLAGQLARIATQIAREWVEFGTYRGATAYCMLDSADAFAPQHQKKIYLYDTFCKTPDALATDREKDVGLVGAFAGTSQEIVLANLNRFRSRVELRPGTIPETLETGGPVQISMMHVDLNLAQPKMDALEWAFPRWNRGGICLLDDYLWDGYEDQRIAVERFFAERDLTILALPTGQGIVIRSQ